MAYDPKPSPSAYDLQMGQGFRGRGSGKSHGKFTVLGYGSFCGSLQEGSHFGEYKERRPLIRLSYLSRDVDSWRFEVRTCKPYLHSCLVPDHFTTLVFPSRRRGVIYKRVELRSWYPCNPCLAVIQLCTMPKHINYSTSSTMRAA